MNILLKKIAYIICLFAAFFSSSCNDIYDEVTSLKTDRLFSPVNFNIALNKTQVTFTWAAADSAVSYTLQVSKDSLNYSTPVLDTTITKLSYVQEFAGATQFYARIRSNSSNNTKASTFNNKLSFKTPAENLFSSYSTIMTGMNQVTANWTPGANVNHLVLTASDKTMQTVQLTANDIAAGSKTITSLSNSTYKVQIYNSDIVRGEVPIVVEGDVYLPAGGNLLAAITAASPGQVIILEPGALYLMGSATYKLSKDIKIRGLLPTNLPILAMTGSASTTMSMLGFVDSSVINSVAFENIDFSGYCDNNSAAVKIGYLFNNNVLTTVSSLYFKNCKLRNFGNTPMRLQGNKNQVIDILSFNNCTIYDIGFASTYAIVNTNSNDHVNNINFNNCTVYNFKGPIVLQTGAYTIGSVNVTNCVFNQTTQDAGNRFEFDLNGLTVTNGIKIKDSVFGSSGISTSGIRTSGTKTITGCYYTSDYKDEFLVGTTPPTSYTFKDKMTSYSGASTDLWNAPTTGDFTLKDSAFKGKGVAGDLRWY
jgi:hypothetical protein